ncbi:MAG: ribosome silencing factor [Proteobacteria bacterium]|nr:ribosome silencing factor [Desulfobulbaceae bacterium]MBU4152271.1 ribosome silencing factor [Pseudomonadota bacterium]MDP2105897.1 ribosome silencing factor [Desulfobulbaceae bacterium]
MKKRKPAFVEKSPLELATMLYNVALDKKGENIVVLDVQKISGFTDYFLIMEGRSTRHVQGLATALEQQMSRKRLTNAKAEGLEEGQWVLLDFGDVIVHIFYHEARQVYDLEGLWHDAPRVDLTSLATSTEGKNL